MVKFLSSIFPSLPLSPLPYFLFPSLSLSLCPSVSLYVSLSVHFSFISLSTELWRIAGMPLVLRGCHLCRDWPWFLCRQRACASPLKSSRCLCENSLSIHRLFLLSKARPEKNFFFYLKCHYVRLLGVPSCSCCGLWCHDSGWWPMEWHTISPRWHPTVQLIPMINVLLIWRHLAVCHRLLT